MHSKILAVFDLDGTLTTGVSLDRDFNRFLLKRNQLKFSSMLLHAAYFMVRIPSDSIGAIKRNKYYLRGITESYLNETARSFIMLNKNTLIVKEAPLMFDFHKKEGHFNILLTGSLYPLVRELICQLDLNLDHFFATELSKKNEVLTGRIDGTHYFGEAKATLIKDLAIQTDADLSKSFCYADSIHDLPMMELFGNPVAVNPDKQLYAVATERNWQILHTTK